MTSHEEDAERLLHVPWLDTSGFDDDTGTTAADGAAPANLKLELRGLLMLSAPVMVQLSAQYAVTVINQYFIGHQGAGPLAAAAIGNTVGLNGKSGQFATCCLQLSGRSQNRFSCSGLMCAGIS